MSTLSNLPLFIHVVFADFASFFLFSPCETNLSLSVRQIINNNNIIFFMKSPLKTMRTVVFFTYSYYINTNGGTSVVVLCRRK
jgi:hypothetical protein